jgi:D,D-heptose 1,7-bisphosphate phosphatase
MNKAIFLDRDGVIVKQKHHLHKKEDLELILNSGKAIRLLNERGYLMIVVSNQPVVARGLCTIQEVNEINHYMEEMLKEQGAKIDRIYFCPHHPTKGNNSEYTKNCECRKPKIGLFLQAQKDLDIDLNESWLIGDKTSDIQAGKNARCRTILVNTGYGGKDCLFSVKPNFLAKDLWNAIYKIK